MAIHERLICFRESKKMNTFDFSIMLGIKELTYKTYERGTRGIPNDIYVKLSEIGCDLNWLIAGIGQKEQKNFISNSQIGNNNKQKNAQSSTNCSDCEIVKTLTETNRKLTDKLLDKL